MKVEWSFINWFYIEITIVLIVKRIFTNFRFFHIFILFENFALEFDKLSLLYYLLKKF